MSKILININNLEEIKDYEKIGITNFLFAIKDFSIGYKTFDIDDIPSSSYILMNRVLDSFDVDKVKSIKDKLSKFKGIIFEDLSIYNIFKDEDIELIWFQNHFGTNIESINYMLDQGITSAIISNEITKEEIEKLISKAHKPLVLNVLGKNQIMYSRRTLLTNFNKYNDLNNLNDMNLVENVTNNNFLARENEYGTIIFNNEYFNYTSLMNENNNILYYLILNLDLNVSDIKEILDGKPFGNDGFLNKKTVYRMSEYNDR